MKKHFNNTIYQFKTTKDRNQNNIDIHYFYYQDPKQTYRHNFKTKESLCDIRSISKTVLALVAGIVYDEKITYQGQTFNKDFLICPVIKDLVDVKNEHNYKTLNKVTIDHLLSHTIGFDQVLMMRNDIKHMDPDDYLNYIVNTPIMHHPGEQYLYSNAGYYLLSVVLQELLQQDLLDYIDKKFFKPLGISDYQWEYYGDYLAGATRLWLYPEDLAKIGTMMLQDGRYNNTQIVSKTWIDYLKTPTTLTPHVDYEKRKLRRYAYAKGLWLAKDDNIFFGHGTDGQTFIMLPKQQAIVITLANQKNVYELEDIIDEFLKEIG